MKNFAVTPGEFVKEFWLLKQSYSKALLSSTEPLAAKDLLAKLELTEQQKENLPELLDAILNDVLYSVLLGLDGAAQIGERQIVYTILDEEGNKICGEMGEVEAAAYEYFHEQK
jgi:hypothetical protein